MRRAPTTDVDPAAATRPIPQIGFRGVGPNGFDILVFSDARGTRVCFGGLEADFDTSEEADAWVERARSDKYRLRIDFIGKRPVRWALEEILSGDDTREVLASGHSVPFWRRRSHRIVYRQNGTGEA